uniref:40S ribosomal protein S15 n=1 Tax=Loa loa TaxID=7209 RepID=A0A1I7VFE6_LOALO
MSDTIIKSAQPAKRELENLLDEVKAMVLTPLDQHLSVEEKEQQFKLKASITLCWYTRINQRKMVGVYLETKECAEKKGRRQLHGYGRR